MTTAMKTTNRGFGRKAGSIVLTNNQVKKFFDLMDGVEDRDSLLMDYESNINDKGEIGPWEVKRKGVPFMWELLLITAHISRNYITTENFRYRINPTVRTLLSKVI